MVYRLVYDYFQYDSYNKLSTTFVTSLVFPAISICNLNYINYTKVAEEMTDYDVMEQFGSYMWILNEMEHLEDPITGLQHYVEIVQSLDKWERDTYTTMDYHYRLQLYDTFVGRYDYIFGGQGFDISPANWSLYDGYTKLGSCMEINDDSSYTQVKYVSP
eukprot:sb/3472920/